jgi:hypothetical protein
VIRLRFGGDNPDRTPCGTLVAGLFTGERPPKGEAGWADWRVGGAISRAILAGRIDGAWGTSVLMPPGKLPARRLLLLGLGQPGEFKGKQLGAAIELALAKLAGLQEDDFAMALPGSKPWPLPKSAAEITGEHLLQPLASAARSARISILGPPELIVELKDWIRTTRGAVASHVVVDEIGSPDPNEVSTGAS